MIFNIGLGGILVIVAALVVSSYRILREYERGVVFMLGRFWKVKGPRLILIIPGVQQMVRVDLRIVVLDAPSQDVISHDNVSVKVNAVVYFRVVGPQKAIIEVENFLAAPTQFAQTTLRSVLGKNELDEMLAERERLNAHIQQTPDQQTSAWGIKVSNAEIKHVDLDESMARQAEAERERRAKVIHAEASCRRQRSCWKPRRCLLVSRRPCRCATCRGSRRLPARSLRPLSSRCRWTSCRRSWARSQGRSRTGPGNMRRMDKR